MTKLEKLEKEYRETLSDFWHKDSSLEIMNSLVEKLTKLDIEISVERAKGISRK